MRRLWALALLACSEDMGTDAALPFDSGREDSGARAEDAGRDARVALPDVGPPPFDAGMRIDGGDAPIDAGVPGVLFVGAGDIAECTALGYAGLVDDPHELTARLIDAYPPSTQVFTLGDHAYSDGTEEQFQFCYGPGWGRFRDRTYPSPGNHDYNSTGARYYYEYFGARAGDPARGYYSYELGGWHVISLNSNCSDAGPGFCDPTSEQLAWLEADLAASTARCTLAYWHHPRWSSDRSGTNDSVAPFVDVLYDHDADLVLVGHAHNYERFARLDPNGDVDPARGIRHIVAGTGGADLRGAEVPARNSEVFISQHGILELVLRPDGYDWRFVPVSGSATDSGSDLCH